MTRPRVLIADDHRMVAEGLKRLLEADFELVAIVEDGRKLLEEAARKKPDVAVVDITMPRLNGLEAIPLLKQAVPGLKIVVITMHREPAYARRALSAGADAFVLKSSAFQELSAAIRAAIDGRPFVTPRLDVPEGATAECDAAAVLTNRQKEIVRLLAGGRTAKEIASALALSVRTVEFHKYRAMEAVGASTSAELIRYALENGIAEP